ncbi:MAG: DUF4349 domain-containing protein [Heliobacteriaceae bacterium]|nr:DUF4349 domain-containing protein [Heliobacteriaceae bacterium]
MNCQQVRESLSPYLDGELAGGEARGITRHLEGCTTCRMEWAGLQATVQAVTGLEEVDPPPGFYQQLMARLDGQGLGAVADRSAPGGGGSFWGRLRHKMAKLMPAGRRHKTGLVLAAALLLVVGFTDWWINADLKGLSTSDQTLQNSLVAGSDPNPAENNGVRQFQLPADSGYNLSLLDGITASGQHRIITGNLSLVVPDVSGALRQIEALVPEWGGYVERSDLTFSNQKQASARLVIRIPPEHFLGAMQQTELVGRLKAKSVAGQDVTGEFVDGEARLKTLREEENRLLVLVGRADQLSDIILLEKELQRVRGEIETLQARLQKLGQLTKLATLNVDLVTEGDLTAPPPRSDFWGYLGYAIRMSFQRLLIGLGESFAYWCLLLLAAGGGYWWWRRRANR